MNEKKQNTGSAKEPAEIQHPDPSNRPPGFVPSKEKPIKTPRKPEIFPVKEPPNEFPRQPEITPETDDDEK